MAIAVQQIHPVAHVPLVLGVLRRLEVATVIDHLIPPHPAHGLSCGRGVEAMVLAILDGRPGRYKGGGVPLRLGVRDGNRSDSVETPVAIEACLALGLEGVRGIVADSKAYSRRTLGVCLEHKIDLITLVPRTCAVRQVLEAWGQQQA